MATDLFSQLYDQYLDKIYRFIYFRVDSEDIAHDLTSRVFLNLWKKLNDPKKTLFSRIKNHQAFLYRSARNAVIDFYRGRNQGVMSLESLSGTISDHSLMNQKSAVEAMEMNADMLAIKDALKHLKLEYSEILIMYYLNDLSIQEIGRIFNKNEGTIRIIIHRAIRALKSEMKIGD